MEKYRYEIRQIEAWNTPEGWTWNTSFYLGTMETAARDEARALRSFLRRAGIVFLRGRTRTEYDGSIYEIQDRKTGEPLFAAIPLF